MATKKNQHQAALVSTAPSGKRKRMPMAEVRKVLGLPPTPVPPVDWAELTLNLRGFVQFVADHAEHSQPGQLTRYRPGARLTLKECQEINACIVYGLCAADGPVVYVGRTFTPHLRMASYRRQVAHRNARLKAWLSEVGDTLRVELLHIDPPDPNAAEMSEIAARAGTLLNVHRGGSQLPKRTSYKPWEVRGRKLPSDMFCAFVALLCADDPDFASSMRSRIDEIVSGLNPVQRAAYELNLACWLSAMRSSTSSRWASQWMSRVGSNVLRYIAVNAHSEVACNGR